MKLRIKGRDNSYYNVWSIRRAAGREAIYACSGELALLG